LAFATRTDPGAKESRRESFSNPSVVGGSDDEKLAAFRVRRDVILRWMERLD